MTKSLGPFDYGHESQRPEPEGRRRRTIVSLCFDAFFPLLIVVIAYLIGRNYFGF
jgi:hypothetical protein